MDIERLKELKSEVSNMAFIAFSKLTDKNARANIVKTGNDLQKLIDEAIARQSVKSEEAVRDAIEWLTNTGHSNQYMSGEWTAPMRNHITRKIQETILAALQAYQPTTRKDRTVEEVAISKTETTSCEYCDGKEKPLHCLRGEHGESVCVGVSKSCGYMSVQKDGDNTLYAIERCPNCGRKLVK